MTHAYHSLSWQSRLGVDHMMKLHATLSTEHTELTGLADRLLRMVTADQPDPNLSQLRWRMNHVLAVHLAKEDKHLYPILRQSSDATTRAMATKFALEMGGLCDAYTAYRDRWTHDAVVADWRGFGDDTRTVIDLLRRRIHREETQLYRRLDAA